LFWVANGDFDRCGAPSVGTILDQKYHAESRSRASGLANTVMQQRPDGEPGVRAKDATGGWQQGATAIAGLRGDLRPGPTHSHWRDADWLCCRDGKWRPVEPGTFPLAHGATSRVGRLRAYGNAINAEVATQFIKGAMTK
jgi:DNA (cytosine-5)-methyltransferase 1